MSVEGAVTLILYYTSFGAVDFLSRELKWIFCGTPAFRKKYELPLEKNLVAEVVLIGNTIEEIDSLEYFESNNLFVYLYADETYDISLNRLVLRNKSVKGVIRNYPLYQKTSTFRSFRKNLSRFIFNIFIGKFSTARLCIAGLVMLFRQLWIKRMHEKHRKPCLIAQLGYTNIFAESVSRLLQTGAESDGSLFHPSSLKIQTKFIDVCFVGQKGNVERQKFVNDVIREMSECEINPNFKVVVREEFGGVRNSLEKTTWCDEYVEILNRASVSICPPGNYSGVTYRYAESLLLYCYPLQSNEVVTDPNWEPYLELDSTPLWESKLEELLNLDDEGRVAATRELREAYFRRLSDLNREILSLR